MKKISYAVRASLLALTFVMSTSFASSEPSLMEVRKQANEAEYDFYETFNQLAEEEKYKVRCRREKRTGTNISSVVCRPQYLIDRTSQVFQESLSLGISRGNLGQLKEGTMFGSVDNTDAYIKKENEAAMAYVSSLVEKHPVLREKLVNMNQKRALLEEAKANR
jgi:hypothetical protein